MDGIHTLKFWLRDEVLHDWPFAIHPFVPRVGDELLGEVHMYRITRVVHEYFVPYGLTSHIYLEELT